MFLLFLSFLCIVQAFDSDIIHNIFAELPIDVNHKYVPTHMQSTCDLIRETAKEYYIYSGNCSLLLTDLNTTFGDLYGSLGWYENALLQVYDNITTTRFHLNMYQKTFLSEWSIVKSICTSPAMFFPILGYIQKMEIADFTTCSHLGDYYKNNTAMNAFGVFGSYRLGNCVSGLYDAFNQQRSKFNHYIDFITNITESAKRKGKIVLDKIEELQDFDRLRVSYKQAHTRTIEAWNRNVGVLSPQTTMGQFYKKHLQHFEAVKNIV